MQLIAGHTDRNLLPRGLIARWRFDIGDAVLFHGELAIVRDRSHTAMGRETYEIELTAHDERPLRTVRGDFLEDRKKARNSGDAIRKAARSLLLLPPADVFCHELARPTAA